MEKISKLSVQIQLLFRSHWIAILIALCTGILTVAPFLVFTQDDAYRGIEMIGSDAEEHYVSRMQEVYDGHPSMGNVFLTNKDQPYAAAGLGEIIVAWIGKVFAMSAVKVNIFSKFFFVFLIAIFTYALVYSMVKIKSAALISSIAPILGYNLISKFSPLLALLKGESIDSMFLVFARPINPQVSNLILIVVLVLLYRAFYERESSKWWEIISIGILTGSTLYISPYVFSFLGLTILVSFIWFLYRKQLILARNVFIAGVVALITLIPFVINYIALSASSEYLELAMRTGAVAKHTPFLLGFWIPIMILSVFFLWPKELNKARIFLLVIFTALLLVINQHVLTGLYLHPGHYHWYITKPFVAIMGGIYIGFILKYFVQKNLHFIVVTGIIAFFFYNASLWQINSYVQRYPVDLETQSYSTLFDYLNTEKNVQSIWAEQRLSFYIPMYTKHNTPNNHSVIYYLNPTKFYENRLFLNYRLREIKPENVLEIMEKERDDVSTKIYGIYIREKTGVSDSVPKEKLLELTDKYEIFYSQNYEKIFKELGVNMIIANQKDRAVYDKIKSLKEIYTDSNFVLYSIDSV
jgi:hypothetical protein